VSTDRRPAIGLVLACSAWFAAATVPSEVAAPSLVAAAVPLGFAGGGFVSALRGWPERIPPRRLAWIGARAAALANVVPAVVPGIGALLVGRVGVGAALALLYPSVLHLTASSAGRRPGAALGSVIAALTVGSASPHLVRALGVSSWRFALVVTSAAVLLGGLVIRTGGPERAPRATGFHAGHVGAVLACRRVRRAMAGYLGHMWELYAGWALAASHLREVWSSPRIGAGAGALVVAVGAIGAWAMGRVGDRIGLVRAARLAMAASGGLALAMPAVPTTPWAVTLALTAWGLFVIADGGLFPALTAGGAGPDLAATALTLQLAAGFALAALTSALAPLAVEHLGWSTAFALLSAGPLIGNLALRGAAPAVPRPAGLLAPAVS